MFEKGQGLWPTIAVASLIACIVLVGLLAYLNAQVSDMKTRVQELESLLSKYTVRANLLINFGNATRRWYNNTRITVGSNLINLTSEAVGNEKVALTISQYGALLTSIDGVGSEKIKPNYFWLWWIWSPEKKEWELAQVGADSYKVRDGDVIAWYYQDTSTWPELETP